MGEDERKLAENASGFGIVSAFREVRLPADLCAAAQQKFGSSFASVQELIVFLLQELVRGDTSALDAAERQAVEQRLKDLGYI